MTDGISELEHKILRLRVRYDGMSDARAADKKALEDEIRGLQDQLEGLKAGPKAPADNPMEREAKEDIDAVKDIFGAESDLTRLQRALAAERRYREDLSKQRYDQDAIENSDATIRNLEHQINALDPTTEDLDLLTDSGAAIATREAGERYLRDQEAAKKAAEAAAKAKRDAYDNAGPAERAVLDEQNTILAGLENPHLEEQLDEARKKDDVLRRQIEEAQKQGCITPPKVLAGIGTGVAVVIAVILVLLNGGDDDKTTTSAGAGASAGADSSDSSAGPMDGHWVLASSLQNPKGLDTSLQTFSNGGPVTFDKSSATIDISGTKITGGTYKTGFTQSTGDPCSILASKVDLIPSGGVDQASGYGQLILDGMSTTTNGCDSNHQPIVQTVPNYHTSHFFYVKGDTLFLCYAINSTTFDSCTEPAGGSAATFKRG